MISWLKFIIPNCECPLFCQKGTEHEWLNVNLKDYEIIDLMKPLVDSKLEVHTISKLITNKNKSPDMP
jgi:putative SOS response-associated peptidase YedK